MGVGGFVERDFERRNRRAPQVLIEIGVRLRFSAALKNATTSSSGYSGT
jgi:hypothetical protein